jgi:thimet oligopeptidase
MRGSDHEDATLFIGEYSLHRIYNVTISIYKMFRIASLKTNFTPRLNSIKPLYQYRNMATTATKYTNNLRFGLSAQQISDITKQIIAESKTIQDKVGALPENGRTFESVVLPLAHDEGVFGTQENTVTFPQYVYTDGDARNAASEAEQQISDFGIESGMRKDVYQALRTVQEKEGDKLKPDEHRLLSRMIRDFERNGLALDEEKQQKVKELKQRLSKLCIDFNKNLVEDKTQVLFTADDLEGCPQDFIEGLQKDQDSGKYIVTLKYPDVMPVMKYAKKSETRKQLDYARQTQCMTENTPLFEEALEIRQQVADLLGFDTHASYVLDIRMAKNTSTVMNFLNDLKSRLTEGGHKELEKLLEYKKQNPYETDTSKIYSWDYLYYDRIMNEAEYQIDESLIKDYFPFDSTFAGFLDIVQETFGFKFEEQQEGAEVWHPDVRLYNVFDAETHSFMGQFYLDMFPRENKYNHFAMFSLQPHCIRADGTEQHPVCALVCNFPKPTASAPSLLKHSDVVTLFHEFGHGQHGFASKAKYARFSGTTVERDFVEMPSQFMENFAYNAEALKRISKHYKTGEPLPDDLIQKIIAAKNAGVALFNLRQLFFGFFDMACHTTKGKIDSAELYAKLRKEVSLIENHEGTNGAASFGHLINGYDANYFGYLYSEVFSVDMFEQFNESGSVFNKDIGKKYRKTVLEVGATRDGIDILRSFLNRDPKPDAFLKSIGL